MENIKTLASESYSTVNSPAQYAAVEAYEGDFSEYKARTLNILRSVGNYVYNNLKSNKVLINPPQGAFYLMPEFPNKKYKTSTELCESILDEIGVAMLPASDFGFSPKKMLTRLCYIDFDGNEFLKAPINGKPLDDKIIEMLNTDRPVIFDCLVDKQENCFPMIPSGKAHNEMILGEIEDKDSVDATGAVLV